MAFPEPTKLPTFNFIFNEIIPPDILGSLGIANKLGSFKKDVPADYKQARIIPGVAAGKKVKKVDKNKTDEIGFTISEPKDIMSADEVKAALVKEEAAYYAAGDSVPENKDIEFLGDILDPDTDPEFFQSDTATAEDEDADETRFDADVNKGEEVEEGDELLDILFGL